MEFVADIIAVVVIIIFSIWYCKSKEDTQKNSKNIKRSTQKRAEISDEELRRKKELEDAYWRGFYDGEDFGEHMKK